MGCCVVIIGFLTPRVLMLFILLLTDWFSRAYETVVWPVLGFIFMPYTTLAYMAAMINNDRTVSGWWLALVIVAVIVDISHWGGGGLSQRRRRR